MGESLIVRGSKNRTRTLTSQLRRVGCAFLVVIAAAADSTRAAQAPSEFDDTSLPQLLKVAREELQAARLSKKEIQLRLTVVENVATVKAYFPHADGGRPEMRNPKYWVENAEGSYIPRGKPSDSIKDLWQTTSGIRCRKLSSLVMLKSLIDVADLQQLAKLDEMLSSKVIPNDLPDQGIGTFFERERPKRGQVFQNDEFLPGDNVWFENPYFAKLSQKQQSRYLGQEGHHVFYIGAGQVMDMYGRRPVPIEDFRRTFLKWQSVTIVAEDEHLEPKSADFQIKGVRRVILKD